LEMDKNWLVFDGFFLQTDDLHTPILMVIVLIW
jgi:hypothetical protein